MSFDQEIYYCGECGRVACHNHHIVYGWGRRKISDKYDCTQIKLCYKCHEAAHGRLDIGYNLNLKLRKQAQKEFVKKYSFELWVKEFEEDYLSNVRG